MLYPTQPPLDAYNAGFDGPRFDACELFVRYALQGSGMSRARAMLLATFMMTRAIDMAVACHDQNPQMIARERKRLLNTSAWRHMNASQRTAFKNYFQLIFGVPFSTKTRSGGQ